MTLLSRSTTVLLAIALVALAASGAEAQRRGRGRRGARRAAPTEPATPPPTESTPPADPFADPPATPPPATPTAATPPPATPTVAPAAQVAPQTPVSTGTPPPATTPPAAAVDPGPTPPDLAPLRQEYVAIMDEMVQARSRVAVLGQELFQTRMTVMVQDRTGDEASLARFVLELDGTPIYNTEGEIEGGGEGRQVFEGALAPGPHVLTLELEQRAREDTEYRVTQRESFRFVVVRERLTEVTIVLEDDSDIARSFPSGGEGHFEIRTRLRVATRALPRS